MYMYQSTPRIMLNQNMYHVGQTIMELRLLVTNIQTHSLHFNGHFPGGPGLTGTRISPFWILFLVRIMEVVVTTEAIRCAKAPVKSLPSTNQHPAFLQAGCPSCRPINSVKAPKKNRLKVNFIYYYRKSINQTNLNDALKKITAGTSDWFVVTQ